MIQVKDLIKSFDGFQALELNDTRYLDGSAVPAR